MPFGAICLKAGTLNDMTLRGAGWLQGIIKMGSRLGGKFVRQA
jgi:hypothetical protein